MHNQGLRSHFIQLSTIPLTAAGLLALSFPAVGIVPLTRTKPRTVDFQACASNLIEAGISEIDAAAACSDTLYPRDLSRCVTRIQGGTEILGADALFGCRRVRRPIELASCVIDIDDERDDAVPLEVIDYCRRSLLPERFSACVVGLSRETDLTTVAVMDTCISAIDRPPPEVLPTLDPPEPEENLRFTPLTPSESPLMPTPPAQTSPTETPAPGMSP